MTPSVKTIRAAFPHLGAIQAVAVRELLLGRRHHPARVILEEVSTALGFYGVEHIPAGHNAKSPGIIYANAGDPYNTTVLFYNDRFHVGNWGDIVERGNYD